MTAPAKIARRNNEPRTAHGSLQRDRDGQDGRAIPLLIPRLTFGARRITTNPPSSAKEGQSLEYFPPENSQTAFSSHAVRHALGVRALGRCGIDGESIEAFDFAAQAH